MESDEELISMAESIYGDPGDDQYGSPLPGREFSPENVFGATELELRMILAFLRKDHLRNVSESSLAEFRQWAAGTWEYGDVWSAGFVLNWLVLRHQNPQWN